MIRIADHLAGPRKVAGLMIAGMLLSCSVQAQLSLKRQKYDSIATRYKDEHAVYTNITEKLEIREEDGGLAATSHVTMEKLLISNYGLSNYNADYFDYDDFKVLTDLAGTAYVPSGNDYKAVPCTGFGEGGAGDDYFYTDDRVVEAYYSGLTRNAVTRTTYALEHTDPHMLRTFWFRMYDIPVLNASYEITAPKYVDIRFAMKNVDTTKLVRTTETKDGNMVTYKFTMTNMPRWKSYSHMSSMGYFVPHIIPYIAKYRLTGARRDSVVMQDPDALYRYLYRYVNALNLKTDASLSRTVKEITQGDVTDRQKAAHIYQWVQKNMHYIAFEKGLEGFVPRPADTIYKRKYGDCKDMTSILVAMCSKAGIEAHFTWIGTRSIPYKVSDAPVFLLYNHMICAAKIDGEWVFMDGTHPLIPFGKAPSGIQGKEAMIAIDAKNYKVMTVPVSAAADNETTDRTTIHIEYHDVVGNITTHYTGESAWDLAGTLMYISKKQQRDKLMRSMMERGTDKFVISNYSTDVNETGSKDATIRADFRVGDYVQEIKKEYYVNMNLTRELSDERINDSARRMPYVFDNKQKMTEIVELDIPKGYRVSYLPKPVKGGVDGLWSYSISYKADTKAKKVILTKEYERDALAIAPDRFDAHNAQIDALKKAYKETVVLTK